jgi:methionyl aminopeptidase
MREASQSSSSSTSGSRQPSHRGVTTQDLDDIARDVFTETGAKSLFLNHHGFTGRICASVNEEIVHGIPGNRILREGDIISVDVGARVGGYCGDSAWTYGVGRISEEARRLLDDTEASLYRGSLRRLAGTGSGTSATPWRITQRSVAMA